MENTPRAVPMNAGLIMFDEEASVSRTLETSHQAMQRRGRSSRKKPKGVGSHMSRNEKKERNLSAMLPNLDKNRYSSTEDQKNNAEANLLNFVQASRKQMRQVIKEQQPQASRFFDDSLKDAAGATPDPAAMPSFSTSQMARLRPSIQSVRHSNRKMELSIAQMSEEISELASSRHHAYKALQKGNFQRQSIPHHHNLTPSLNALVSPRAGGLLQTNPSKVSLVTESYQAKAQSVAGHTQMSHSPTGGSQATATLSRELKHLSRYLDAREIQIRTKLEGTTKIDSKLEENVNLEELFHQVMGQVRSKLPSHSQTLNDLVKRIMDGLQECFTTQGKGYAKKVDVRNKKIDALKAELAQVKEDFHQFRNNSTMDAYFKKYSDVVQRTGRNEKDYIKDLVKTVDDFLDQGPLQNTELSDERQVSKDAEPSGVESMLLHLQIQASRQQELPQITENPLSTVDAEKDNVMQDFKKALNTEAVGVRYLIESHVKRQMGLTKPTAVAQVQTLTWRRLEDEIVDNVRHEIEETERERAQQANDIRGDRLNKEIEALTEKYNSVKDKAWQLQRKLASTSQDAFLDDIKVKINNFFSKKLGKKNAGILKEFNEKILEIAIVDQPKSAASLVNKVDDMYLDRSQNTMKRLANKFEHRMSLRSQSSEHMSETNIQRLVRKSTRMAEALASSNASVGSVDRAAAQDSIEEDGGEHTPIAKLTDSQELDLKKLVSKDGSSSPAIVAQDQGAASEESVSLGGDVSRANDAVEEMSPSRSKSPVRSPSKSKAHSPEPATSQLSQKRSSLEHRSPNSRSKSALKKVEGRSQSPSHREASPSPTPQDAGTTPVEPKDDRKELLDKLSRVKSITTATKDFQSYEKLKQEDKKATKVQGLLHQVYAQATMALKIVKLNTEDTGVIAEVQTLSMSAADLFNKAETIGAIKTKIQKGLELHKAIDKISKFLKEQKKAKSMADRDKILAQLHGLNEANNLAVKLPIKAEIEKLAQTDKAARDLQKHLTAALAKKIVQPVIQQTTVVQAAPLAQVPPAQAPVKQPEPQRQPPSETLSKDGPSVTPTPVTPQEPEVAAISGIELVREQITESHDLLLSAPQVSPQEHKMLDKVKRLLSHMDEAIHWLKKRRESGISQADNALLEQSASEQQSERHTNNPRRLSSHARTEQTQQVVATHQVPLQAESHQLASSGRDAATPTPYQDPSFVAIDKINIDLAMEEGAQLADMPTTNLGALNTGHGKPDAQDKIIRVKRDVQLYLAEQDIEPVKEDAVREADQSRVSSKSAQLMRQTKNRLSQNGQLDNIGEVVSSGSVADRNIESRQSRQGHQSRQSRQGHQSRQSHETPQSPTVEDFTSANEATDTFFGDRRKPSRVEVFRKTPSVVKQIDTVEQADASDTVSRQPTQSPRNDNDDKAGPQGQQMLEEVCSTPGLVSNDPTTTSPIMRIDSDQNLIGNNAETRGRMQLADLLKMDHTQKFTEGQQPEPVIEQYTLQAKKGSKLVPPSNMTLGQQPEPNQVKDIAANLRQSVVETDYLKTVSHFGQEGGQADLRTINVGQVQTDINTANETQNFLNDLKSQLPRDKKKLVQQQHRKKKLLAGDNQIKLNTPGSLLNQDLVGSQGSSIDHNDIQDQTSIKPSLYTMVSKADQSSPRKGGLKTASQSKAQMANEMAKARSKAPSALQISQKPFHSHIKMVQENSPGDGSYAVVDGDLIPQGMASRDHNKPVLMLTESTQTENRSLIKYMLTLINETMMAQLQEQSVRMTKEEFEETVDHMQKVIPKVYEQVKDKSDAFFVDEPANTGQQLEPQYHDSSLKHQQQDQDDHETTTLTHSRHRQFRPQVTGVVGEGINLSSHYPTTTNYNNAQTNFQIGGGAQHNRDLDNLMDDQAQQERAKNAIFGGGITVGKRIGAHMPSLSVSPSTHSLNRTPSQRQVNTVTIGLDDLPEANAQNGSKTKRRFSKSPSPSQRDMSNLQNSSSSHYLMAHRNSQDHLSRQQQQQPLLSLGDFSRYGNHTLELSQEVKQRVNLKQIGGTGGGFMGKVVRSIPPI